jgi:hypothetical protein
LKPYIVINNFLKDVLFGNYFYSEVSLNGTNQATKKDGIVAIIVQTKKYLYPK